MRAAEHLTKNLDANVLVRLIASAADVSLFLDGSGTVRDIVLGDKAPSATSAWQSTVGQPWVKTVTIDSQPKVESMLSECSSIGHSRPREVNQVLDQGQESAFRFSAVRLGPQSMVIVGRDLSAVAAQQQLVLKSQQALEREYNKLRQGESLYRTLYHLSSEGVLIADGATLKITDINPAAAAAVNSTPRDLAGRPLLDLVDELDLLAARSTIKSVLDGGPVATVTVHLRATGKTTPWSVAAARHDRATALLVRFGTPPESTGIMSLKRRQMLTAIEVMPDGFVVLDESMKVLAANPMFCELAQLVHESPAVGQHISRWLGRPGVDVNVVASTLREHGSVRNFATIVRGELGQTTDVNLSAVSALNGELPCIAFVLRPAGARISTMTPTARSVEQLRGLVGQVSLKELVRESAELVERMCIEAALNLTNNNRASAAQMLGLSRQGLYSKLRRHGLGA